MIHNTKERATQVAVDGKEATNNNEEKMSSVDDNNTRSFGSATLWFIRKNARSFKIHDRIPRL